MTAATYPTRRLVVTITASVDADVWAAEYGISHKSGASLLDDFRAAMTTAAQESYPVRVDVEVRSSENRVEVR